MDVPVIPSRIRRIRSLLAELTRMRIIRPVHGVQVFSQMIRIGVSESAQVTFIRPGIQMLRHDVTVQETSPFKSPRAFIALELLLLHMRRLFVRGQIRFLGESGTAEIAGKGFLSRVNSLVVL